jgi:hypothetical protein
LEKEHKGTEAEQSGFRAGRSTDNKKVNLLFLI